MFIACCSAIRCFVVEVAAATVPAVARGSACGRAGLVIERFAFGPE